MYNPKELPFKTFVRATGRDEQINIIISDLAYRAIEEFKEPIKVILGKGALLGCGNDWTKAKSYWIGTFGYNCDIEIVDGYKIELLTKDIK